MLRNACLSFLERTGTTLKVFRLREFVRRLDIPVILRNRRYPDGVASDGYEIPPARLRTLVAGTADIEWFLEYGATSARSMQAMLQRHGVDLRSFRTILDFGCGCGRVLRHLSGLEHSHLHGCDYNPDLVRWCQDHLPFASVDRNELVPQLDYPEHHFDFIYALSVFTHLPETLQRAWALELARVLKPGGYLLITTQGESFLPHLTQAEREQFERGELIVRHDSVAGTNLCAVFHPLAYVQHRLFNELEIIDIASSARGETHGVLQDVTLVRKPISSPGLNEMAPTDC